MHNCKEFHSGKTHRRRNRRLRLTLEPLHWWDHPKRKSHWAMGAFTHVVDASGNRPKPGKSSAASAPASTTDDNAIKDGKLIQLANQSVLGQLGSGVRKFFKVKRSS